MSSKLNGSVDQLANALRDVISEAVEEKMEEKIDPLRKEVKQNNMLLRAMARQTLPPEVFEGFQEDARS